MNHTGGNKPKSVNLVGSGMLNVFSMVHSFLHSNGAHLVSVQNIICVLFSKGSLHEKNPEIVWYFAKPGGGGTPQTNSYAFSGFFPGKNGNCTKLR